MKKIFGYKAGKLFGRISEGIVIAESDKDARKYLEGKFCEEDDDIREFYEIPLENGVVEVSFYDEV